MGYRSGDLDGSKELTRQNGGMGFWPLHRGLSPLCVCFRFYRAGLQYWHRGGIFTTKIMAIPWGYGLPYSPSVALPLPFGRVQRGTRDTQVLMLWKRAALKMGKYDGHSKRKSPAPEHFPAHRAERRRNDPTLRFTVITIGTSLAGALVLWKAAGAVDFIYSWLISVSLVTFITYGYDKTVAGSIWTRVPEKVLHLLALLGGTLGALLGMRLFRHKTAKSSFRLRFVLVVAVQVVAVVAYFIWLRPLWEKIGS